MLACAERWAPCTRWWASGPPTTRWRRRSCSGGWTRTQTGRSVRTRHVNNVWRCWAPLFAKRGWPVNCLSVRIFADKHPKSKVQALSPNIALSNIIKHCLYVPTGGVHQHHQAGPPALKHSGEDTRANVIQRVRTSREIIDYGYTTAARILCVKILLQQFLGSLGSNVLFHVPATSCHHSSLSWSCQN